MKPRERDETIRQLEMEVCRLTNLCFKLDEHHRRQIKENQVIYRRIEALENVNQDKGDLDEK